MNKSSSPLPSGVPAPVVREGGAQRAGGDVQAGHAVATPSWIWAALLAGAVVTLWWAWFVSGFLSEPSAVGRVLVVLLTSIGLSALSGLAGAAGAVGLLRRDTWGRPLAWIAAVALILSIAGAIGGVPAVIGLIASRDSARP